MSKYPSIHSLITMLRANFGEEKVLTAPEHLYIYSHIGAFGFKKLDQPLAILRISSKDELDLLEELLANSDIPVVMIDDLENPDNMFNEQFILVDTQKTIGVQALQSRLSELNREKEEQKTDLKTAVSFPHWFNKKIQEKDGFRVKEDKGFCVVESYFNGVQTYSSKGRLTLARGLLKGELETSPLLSDSIFSCTGCGQCYDQYSDNTFEINNALLKARKTITEREGCPERFRRIHENIKTNGNPQGLDKEDRTIWYEKVAEKHELTKNSILYWTGCTTSYRLPEVVEATTSVMDKLGLEFSILGDNEGCCGLILYLSGQWREARENAEKVIESIDDAETLVTSCAGCYYMFSKVYAELGIKVPFKVLHSSQLMAQSLKDIKLKPMKGNFTWHDPCDLGRHSNVYEPPRQVLRMIPNLNLVDPELTREHTVCCGAGGGLWTYNEEITDHVLQQKIMKTLPKDLQGVITGCPTCLLSMRNAARKHRPNLKIHDLAEIVEKCL